MARQKTPTKDLFTLTESAAARVQEILDSREKPAKGIRIGVKSRGCSGYTYTLEFADEKQERDEVVTSKDVTIFVDPKAILFIIGTVMDFVDEKVQSGFVFRNPNEKGRCGCGESFHV